MVETIWDVGVGLASLAAAALLIIIAQRRFRRADGDAADMGLD